MEKDNWSTHVHKVDLDPGAPSLAPGKAGRNRTQAPPPPPTLRSEPAPSLTGPRSQRRGREGGWRGWSRVRDGGLPAPYPAFLGFPHSREPPEARSGPKGKKRGSQGPGDHGNRVVWFPRPIHGLRPRGAPGSGAATPPPRPVGAPTPRLRPPSRDQRPRTGSGSRWQSPRPTETPVRDPGAGTRALAAPRQRAALTWQQGDPSPVPEAVTPQNQTPAAPGHAEPQGPVSLAPTGPLAMPCTRPHPPLATDRP
ncbi:basic proline-rich protein-like [Alexandromys fortis]|uniref:basic proline-rich protein-like n=1 Tax=Alexandromys fortis TaxID=100897 RepID=UPI00215380BC|nr:basic proline-rich protein-like [Microtus fortis]